MVRGIAGRRHAHPRRGRSPGQERSRRKAGSAKGQAAMLNMLIVLAELLLDN
jgi:hypothetical protein